MREPIDCDMMLGSNVDANSLGQSSFSLSPGKEARYVDRAHIGDNTRRSKYRQEVGAEVQDKQHNSKLANKSQAIEETSLRNRQRSSSITSDYYSSSQNSPSISTPFRTRRGQNQRIRSLRLNEEKWQAETEASNKLAGPNIGVSTAIATRIYENPAFKCPNQSISQQTSIMSTDTGRTYGQLFSSIEANESVCKKGRQTRSEREEEIEGPQQQETETETETETEPDLEHSKAAYKR